MQDKYCVEWMHTPFKANTGALAAAQLLLLCVSVRLDGFLPNKKNW